MYRRAKPKRELTQPSFTDCPPTFNNPFQQKNMLIKITEIYSYIYSDSLSKILQKSPNDISLYFINEIESKAIDILNRNFTENETKNNFFINSINKIKSDFKNKLTVSYNILTQTLQNFFKNKYNYGNYLTNFIKHCPNTDNIGTHLCKNGICGKFIIAKNKYEENEFVICTKCKYVYTLNMIKMFCASCNKNYYSSYLNENEDPNILPATWKKYHCKKNINNIMKCILCKSNLFLNLKTNKLICLNKKCDFSSKPESILWKCCFCSKDFRSEAKIYNSTKKEVIKYAINKSLLFKIKAIPKCTYLPCCRKKNSNELNFFHNKDCNGILYKGQLDNQDLVICEKCNAINLYDKFYWICPFCKKKFHNQCINVMGTEINFYNKKSSSIERYSTSCKNGHNNKENNNDSIDEEIDLIISPKNICQKTQTNFNKFNILNKNNSQGKIITLESSDYRKSIDNSLHKMIYMNYIGEKNNSKKKYLIDILDERKNSEKRQKEISNDKNVSNNEEFFVKHNKSAENRNNYHRIKTGNIIMPQNKDENAVNMKQNYYTRMRIYSNCNNKLKKIENEIEKQNYATQSRFYQKKSPNYYQKPSSKFSESNNENSVSKNEIKDNKESKKIFNKKNICIKTPINVKKNEYRYHFDKNNIVEKEAIKSSINDTDIRSTKNRVVKPFQFYNPRKNKNNVNKIYEEYNRSKINNFEENISHNKSDTKNYEKNTSGFSKGKRYYYKRRKASEEISPFDDLNEDKNKDTQKEEDIYSQKQKPFLKNNENKIIINNFNFNLITKNSNIKITNQNEKIEKKKVTKIVKFSKNVKLIKAKSKNYFVSTNKNNQLTTSNEKVEKLLSESKIPLLKDNDYEYVRSIGEGSYGVIYLVQEVKTRETFAIKKIICNNFEEVEKFKEEFELIYSFDNEHILKIFKLQIKCLDLTTYSLYVLMEIAENDWNIEIKRRALAKKFYKEQELINILKQIVSGLYFLQQKKFAHRDIKPQNILIFPNNLYKVADLGEAKYINRNKLQMATVRGSELFMSPLLYNGYKYNKKNIAHNPYKSDVCSLGYCVLFAVCLNIRILENIREIDNMKTIKNIIAKFANKTKYSEKFLKMILKMIDIEENKRYDFNELNKELNENFGI